MRQKTLVMAAENSALHHGNKLYIKLYIIALVSIRDSVQYFFFIIPNIWLVKYSWNVLPLYRSAVRVVQAHPVTLPAASICAF